VDTQAMGRMASVARQHMEAVGRLRMELRRMGRVGTIIELGNAAGKHCMASWTAIGIYRAFRKSEAFAAQGRQAG
jgi:hypothetical protein